MKAINLTKCAIVLCLAISTACSSSKKDPQNPGSASQKVSESDAGGTTNGYANPVGDITVLCGSAVGDFLKVTMGQTVTWTFNAVTTGNYNANIQGINVSPQPSSLIVNGNSITFTPTTNADLTGVVNVIAEHNGKTGNKVFRWGTDSSVNINQWGNLIHGILNMGILNGGGVNNGGVDDDYDYEDEE